MNLATTDWLLCAVLLLSMLVGAWRGLVYELMSLAAWVAAFVLAQWLAQDVALKLPLLQSAAAQVQYAAAFVLVFVLTLFAAGFLSWLLKKVVETVGLRPVDRALGALFGVARGVLLEQRHRDPDQVAPDQIGRERAQGHGRQDRIQPQAQRIAQPGAEHGTAADGEKTGGIHCGDFTLPVESRLCRNAPRHHGRR